MLENSCWTWLGPTFRIPIFVFWFFVLFKLKSIGCSLCTRTLFKLISNAVVLAEILWYLSVAASCYFKQNRYITWCEGLSFFFVSPQFTSYNTGTHF